MSNDNSDFTKGLLAFLGGAAAVLAVAGSMGPEERQQPTRQRKPRTKKNKALSRTVTVTKTQTAKFRECARCNHTNQLHNYICRNCYAKIQ